MLLILIYPSLVLAQLEIICYDVGQGNCTLILCHNYALKIPPLLVDAGSTAYKKFRSAKFKEEQIKRISEKINPYLKLINKKEITLVASHADVDHYRWLPKIIAACTKLDNGIYVSKMFLGSARDLYIARGFQSFLNKIEPDDGSPSPINFVTLLGDKHAVTEICNNGPINYWIGPALQGAVEADKNKSSLVVFVQDGQMKMAIMGDAEKATTDYIPAHLPPEHNLLNYGCMLHAAHHGAATHGSNEDVWLQLLQVRGAILSSGVNPDLRHPSGVIVKLINDSLPEEAGSQYYPLYFGFDGAALRCYAKGSLGYGLTAFRKSIRGTLTHGTVTYTYDQVSNKVVASCERSTASDTLKTCILKMLCTFPRGLLEQDHLQEIDLSQMHIKDNDDPDTDKELLHKFFDALINKAAFLKLLLMPGNAISGDLSIQKIRELMNKNRPALERVDLSNNGIAPDRHEAIKVPLGILAAKLVL